MNIFKDEELWDNNIPIFSLSNEEAEEELEMKFRANCQKFEMFDAALKQTEDVCAVEIANGCQSRFENLAVGVEFRILSLEDQNWRKANDKIDQADAKMNVVSTSNNNLEESHCSKSSIKTKAKKAQKKNREESSSSDATHSNMSKKKLDFEQGT